MMQTDRRAPAPRAAAQRGGSRPGGAWLAWTVAVAVTPSELGATNVQADRVRQAAVWSAPSVAEAGAPAKASTDDLFIIDPAAGLLLRELWLESRAASVERVACLGGYYDERERAVHVTRVESVPSRADSLRSEAGPSLEKCGPPMWSGTVHTHIALYRGVPYSTFSPNDRAVMSLWRNRWRDEGLFCVLYSEALAYCEWGPALSGDVAYNEVPAPLIGAE